MPAVFLESRFLEHREVRDVARPLETFLDIETDWHRRLTVVGFRSSATGVVQLVGDEITPGRLIRELPRTGRLYTYNGDCFDLPCIRKRLRIDLRERFDTVDLRWPCQRNGLRGGQKAIEERLGRRRPLTDGLDGSDAIGLWEEYRYGNEQALRVLLRYNADDLIGLRTIRRYLGRRGILPV